MNYSSKEYSNELFLTKVILLKYPAVPPMELIFDSDNEESCMIFLKHPAPLTLSPPRNIINTDNESLWILTEEDSTLNDESIEESSSLINGISGFVLHTPVSKMKLSKYQKKEQVHNKMILQLVWWIR